MALKIIRNDILKMKVDAIVNPTDEQLSGSGSIDWKIHHICGDSLKDELKNIGNLKEGQAIITNASNLPCKYIIHTVGPTYKNKNEDFTILENSYKNSLSLAMDNNIKSIAFPLIATGTFEFPIEQAIPIAINTIKSFLAKNEIDVYLAVYSSEAFGISKKIITDIESFIDDEDIEKENDVLANYLAPFQEKVINRKRNRVFARSCYNSSSVLENYACESYLGDSEAEDFRTKLFNIIDRCGLKDADVYNYAGVSKMVFSNIRKGVIPKKKTIFQLCIALPINIDEAYELLASAGYTFVMSDRYERTIKKIIENKNAKYLTRVDAIDMLLYELKMPLFLN